MKNRHCVSILLLAAATAACETVTAPDATRSDMPGFAAAQHVAASGIFAQTGINTLTVRNVGPNTILEQTSAGSVAGTLSGSYDDDLRVVIHPNGSFNAHFTIACQCTVGGQSGTLRLVASDRGELISPTAAAFSGRVVITGGTGELSDLRGVLAIEGTIDLVTGLATYAYSGSIH